MALFYQSYIRPILNGEIYEANVFGKFVSILTWNNAIDLQISIEGQSFSPIKAGMSVRLPDIDKPFYVIRFQNITGVTVNLQYAVSDGQIIDNRFNSVGVISVITPGLAAATYGHTPCSNVAPGTLIIPANPLRRSFFVQNLLTNGGNMYIGFDNLLTNVHYAALLLPGVAYTNNDYTGDVYSLATVNLEAISFDEI